MPSPADRAARIVDVVDGARRELQRIADVRAWVVAEVPNGPLQDSITSALDTYEQATKSAARSEVQAVTQES